MYKFAAEDLEDKDLLGMGVHGKVVKMWHSKTNTMMAVKVNIMYDNVCIVPHT